MIRFPAVFALSIATAASAQMSVHVVAGVVKSTAHGELSVATENGAAMQQFHLSDSAPVLNFDPTLRAGTVKAAAFDKVGDSVLLFYYGWDNNMTAAAVRDLGVSPYTRTTGTVTAFDKKTRALTVKDDSGKELSLALDPDLVVDTDSGVSDGRKFAPHKGDHVRVIYGGGDKGDVVLLGEMM